MNKFRTTLDTFDKLSDQVEVKQTLKESPGDTHYISKMKGVFTKMENAASLKEEYGDEDMPGASVEKEEEKKETFPFGGKKESGESEGKSEGELEEKSERELLEEILECVKRIEEKSSPRAD